MSASARKYALPTIFRRLRYRDAKAAIGLLCEGLGFQRHAVYEGKDGASCMPSSPSATAW